MHERESTPDLRALREQLRLTQTRLAQGLGITFVTSNLWGTALLGHASYSTTEPCVRSVSERARAGVEALQVHGLSGSICWRLEILTVPLDDPARE